MDERLVTDNINHEIKLELFKAKKSIKIAVAWIDFNYFEDCFKKIVKNNVDISIIANDDSKNNKFQAVIDKLVEKGVKINLIKNKKIINCMHNKFCLIDREVVIVGSHNWTRNAAFNFESILVLKLPERIILQYEYEFEHIKLFSEHGTYKMLKFGKCPECKGKLINALIFHDNDGHLIQICSDDSSHYTEIDTIEDRELLNIIDRVNHQFEEMDSAESEIHYKIAVDTLVNEYCYKRFKRYPIHAIGRIDIERGYFAEGELITKFDWFSKFSSNYLEKEYYDTFDIL